MKLGTLRNYFRHRAKSTLLYLVNDQHQGAFLLTGVAFRPREEDDALLIDVEPYIVYSFDRDGVLRSEGAFRGLRLTNDTTVTRRFDTHCRHAMKLGNQDALPGLARYLNESRALRMESTNR